MRNELFPYERHLKLTLIYFHTNLGSILIASLKKVAKRPRRRYYNALGVKDVLAACKNVEVFKNGAQIEWDELIAQYDKPKEPEFHESEDELGDINHGLRKKDHESSDEKLGMLLLPAAEYLYLVSESSF